MQRGDRSLRELQYEADQTRAGLTETVNELRTGVADTVADIKQRISPEAIKTEVAGYVRARGERLLEDISAAARRNPMQAVAVGASLAYPLLRLARAIPVPVLMVGAGLFLAGSKTGQSLTQKASDAAADLYEEAGRQGEKLSDRVEEAVGSARRAVTEAADRARGVVSDGAEQMRGATAMADAGSDRLREGATSLGETAMAKAQDFKAGASALASSAADTVRGAAGSAAAMTRDAAVAARDSGRETAQNIQSRASDLSNRAGKTVSESIQQNPLLVAGLGLIVGGLIASALPRTELEHEWAGEASAAARSRARQAAAKGFEAAKGAAEEIVAGVARQAGSEGLTPHQLDETARDIGQRVRRVAETAVTTAFDPDKADSLSNTRGGRDHG
jgi:hypothetical protein